MSSERFLDVLEKNGYRLTEARRAIIGALVATEGHLSADDLVDVVRRDAPRVGRMTVYRTLEVLCELGLLRPVYQGTGAAHYILLDNGHHHHLICSSCDKVIEFDECMIQEVGRILSGRFDFQIQSHLLEIYGLCQACAETEHG